MPIINKLPGSTFYSILLTTIKLMAILALVHSWKIFARKTQAVTIILCEWICISLWILLRLSGTCSHVIGLVYTLAHYQHQGLKEVPDELSSTSLPQQWHKPRGRKVKPQPVTSLVMAKPKKDRKRRPVLTTQTKQRYKLNITTCRFISNRSFTSQKCQVFLNVDLVYTSSLHVLLMLMILFQEDFL